MLFALQCSFYFICTVSDFQSRLCPPTQLPIIWKRTLSAQGLHRGGSNYFSATFSEISITFQLITSGQWHEIGIHCAKFLGIYPTLAFLTGEMNLACIQGSYEFPMIFKFSANFLISAFDGFQSPYGMIMVVTFPQIWFLHRHILGIVK